MLAVSKRNLKFRSDHPFFIPWWRHVCWSAFAAFRLNLHRIVPVIRRFFGEANAFPSRPAIRRAIQVALNEL
jgi:hypothetical protein